MLRFWKDYFVLATLALVAIALCLLPGVALAVHCPYDLNFDNVVDGADLSIVLACWGPNPTGSCILADFDHNNSVDSGDVGSLLANWGSCP